MSDVEEVEISCSFLRATARAVLIEDGNDEVWIPRSQIIDSDKDIDSLEREDEFTITIPQWLADEKGLV